MVDQYSTDSALVGIVAETSLYETPKASTERIKVTTGFTAVSPMPLLSLLVS